MTSLSTSNFRRNLKIWSSRYSLDMLLALGIVSLLEASLHLGAPYLFPKQETGDFRSDVIAEGIEKAEKFENIDVAIIGSSVTSAVDKKLLESGLGKEARVENFQVYSADSQGALQMLETVILPNLKSKWIIYVVSPRDVNVSNPYFNVADLNKEIPDIQAYSKNPFTYKMGRWIETNFYLYRYRTVLFSRIRGLITHKNVPSELGDNNNLNPQGSDGKGRDQKNDPAFNKFKSAERLFSDFKTINKVSKQAGSRLLIVALPTNPSPKITSETFKKQTLAWVSSLQAFAHANKIDFISTLDVVDRPEQFKDGHHLSLEGKTPVTQKVAEFIKHSN